MALDNNIITPVSPILRMISQYQTGYNNMNSLDDELAYVNYKKIRESALHVAGLIEASLPKVNEYASKVAGSNVYVVEVKLSNLGEAMLLTLQRGCCWNVDTMSYDAWATEDFYKKYLEDNWVPETIIEMVARLNDPFHQPLKREYVAFKLQAIAKTGSSIINNTNSGNDVNCTTFYTIEN